MNNDSDDVRLPAEVLKIGLLVCDHVLPHLLPIGGSHQDRFATLFSGRPEIELHPYDLVAGEYPDNPSDCDGWISTGSKHAVSDDEPWIAWLVEFVRRLHEERSPHVGVCFGAQMIAHALGGEVTLQAAGWGVGVARTKVGGEAEWMVPRPDSYQVAVSYHDQITKLPPGSTSDGLHGPLPCLDVHHRGSHPRHQRPPRDANPVHKDPDPVKTRDPHPRGGR